MKTIWAVSCGEYDHYGVVALCPDETTARAACERMNAPERMRGNHYGYVFFVEELRAIDAIDEVAIVTEYSVDVDLNGKEIERETESYLAWDAEEGAQTSGPIHRLERGGAVELTGAVGVSTVGYDEALASALVELEKAKR